MKDMEEKERKNTAVNGKWMAVWAVLLVLAGEGLRAEGQLDVSIRLPDKSGRRVDRPEVGRMDSENRTYYPGKLDRRFDEMLDRRLPGVRYDQGQVFIRNRPCLYYLVDGVPLSSLEGVDPLSVRSISVLSDMASTSLYGSRGRNGAVIVETFARAR